jgi:hypothetical protein
MSIIKNLNNLLIIVYLTPCVILPQVTLLLFTEQEIVSKVDLNTVIDKFNSMGNR